MSNRDLIKAAQNGHLDIVERLLKDPRVDPADYDNDAIRWAAENGHIDVVERLLKDPRVNPADDDNYAIRWAAHNGHLDVFNLLWHLDSCRRYYEQE